MKIIFPGQPIPKHRPRFTRQGRTYSDQKKETETAQLTAKTQKIEKELISKPIAIVITFFMQTPKSISNKKKKELNQKPHTSKPDLDNLVKFYCDALNKTIIEDDKTIAEIHAFKVYSNTPRTELEIITL